MKGGVLATEIDEEIIFDQLQKKYGAVWSMLLASGYLKVVDRKFSQETGPASAARKGRHPWVASSWVA